VNKVTALPNFLIVGAAKSGTTSLYYYLKQHPEIFMPHIKEPLFFCFYDIPEREFANVIYPNDPDEYIRDFRSYADLFLKQARPKAVGEASAGYLFYYKKTIQNMRKLLPDWKNIKIIIILRNPVEASFSHYSMYQMRGDEIHTFEESLQKEKEVLSTGKGLDTLVHFQRFFYYSQVKAYLESFNHVKIYLYDDLVYNQLETIQGMYTFLGVDSSYIPDMEIKYNATGTPKSEFIHNFLTKPNLLKKVVKPLISMISSDENIIRMMELIKSKNLSTSKPLINNEMKMRLTEYYREDILRLQKLIKRDLHHWLQMKCQD
jgi:hypothetical protein